MSRFGSTAQFHYDAGTDIYAGGTTIQLDEQDMPQYPVDEFRESDRQIYRSKSGQMFSTENYNKRGYTFNWTDLSESKKHELATTADSLPILLFASGGNNWGTFRMVPDSFSASESLFELYNVSFDVIEDN